MFFVDFRARAQDAATGDWPHESIVGVFNANCMITYMNYRNQFALKALGRFCAKFPTKK